MKASSAATTSPATCAVEGNPEEAIVVAVGLGLLFTIHGYSGAALQKTASVSSTSSCLVRDTEEIIEALNFV